MSAAGFNTAEFRHALGSFATGVTVITTRDADGAPLGLTANSFNSVSLDPPLVLWSLAKSALCLSAFQSAEHWAVHVLAADQEALSARFAKRGADKFAGLEALSGIGGVPLLANCAARFQCRNTFQYDGGDHLIFVGEVASFERSTAAPLVFHAGRYAWATQKSAAAPRLPDLRGSFDEHFLGYLMGRGHFQFYHGLHASLDAAGLDDDEYFVLATLTVHDTLRGDEIDTAIGYSLKQRSSEALRTLVWRKLLIESVDAEGQKVFCLSHSGRTLALELIAVAKSIETSIVQRLGEADSNALRTLLHKLVTVTDPGLPDVWNGAQVIQHH